MSDSDKKKSQGKDLSDQRYEYGRFALRRDTLANNPFDQFSAWYKDAEDKHDGYPNPVMLSTVDEDNAPHSRIVLLKSFNSKGFVFYTNYQSRKAQHIENNPQVSLSFFWESLERQVHIRGVAQAYSNHEADSYFASRPRNSQLSAWASMQSESITSRQVLEESYSKFEAVYQDKAVPRPENWGGYLIQPTAFEFWQGQKSRLHDRFSYKHLTNSTCDYFVKFLTIVSLLIYQFNIFSVHSAWPKLSHRTQ